MRIKVSLNNGTVVEKELITAFKTSIGEYVVLDNEAVGSMGLPIILVSKLNNNNLDKIVDQQEWEQVKEFLKTIISNGNMNYIPVVKELVGAEVFYTQLTLPEASFGALKNNYTIILEEEKTNNANVLPEIPSVEEIPEPTNILEKALEEPVTEQPVLAPVEEPVVESVKVSEVEPVLPVEPQPVVEPTQVVEPAPVLEPITTPEIPTAEPTPIVEQPVDQNKILKEEFLKSCEELFDNLIEKLNK